MRQVFFLIVGGSFGTLARFTVVKAVQSRLPTLFPWGTMIVNLSGSFIIGFLFILFEESFISRDFRALMMIGFLGAYTTFSTFSLETLNLMRDGEMTAAAGNILLTNFLGITCAFLGLLAGRVFLKFIKG